MVRYLGKAMILPNQRAKAALVGLAASFILAQGVAHADERGAATPDGRSAACSALSSMTVPASKIGLPTSGAVVTSAEFVTAKGPKPEFCKIIGQVKAANPADMPIEFELNLPSQWNGKAVQFGGGGFNGFLVDGLGPGPGQSMSAVFPLAGGYVTYGSDSGHKGQGFDGRFGANVQALANYSGESVKRTHDVAAFFVSQFYGRPAKRTYYVGGSKGGQEGLVAVQRYPDDFDGVVSFFPAFQNQGQVTAWYTMWQAAYSTKGAALNLAKQALLKQATLNACDALDGARDGVIANITACRSTFAINHLRCPGGGDTGDTCLSDPQIDALEVANRSYRFPFPLANGVTEVGGFPVYLGADLNGMIYGRDGGDGKTAIYRAFADQVYPYFVAGDPAFPVDSYNVRDHEKRVREISEIYDTENADIDRFLARKGKLILVQGTIDMLVPETLTTGYVDRLRQRYGDRLRGFVRYYLQPGYGHNTGDFVLNWDALAALDNWAETGVAPAKPIAVDANPATAGRSMPLCEQPSYPRYVGTGNVRDAASYRCTLP